MSELETLIGEFGLAEHRKYLLSIARCCVEIGASEAPIVPACSKFGGAPDLPSEFAWPQHELGPYRFIGQINLAELPSGAHGLPETGLLSVFYAHDEKGEAFWGDPNYVRAYYFVALDRLEAVDPPEAVRWGSTVRLRFQLGMDIPPWTWSESAAQWPIPAEFSDAYWDLRSRLHRTGRYLMGYPYNTTLGYDPTPGPEWVSLLTLSSDRELMWCWHDDDWLVSFIEIEKLQRGEFSQIAADAG